MRSLLLPLAVALLSSCALERDVPAPVAGPIDSLVRAKVGLGKVKFKGPVTFQIGGAGNTSTATAIGKNKAPVAAAPGASATETRTKSGMPWWVYAGAAGLCLAVGFYLARRLPAWWPM